MSKRLSGTCAAALAAALVGISAHGAAEDTAAAELSLMEAVSGGSVSADVRLRAEHGDLEGAQSSDAITIRPRVGYKTAPWKGLTGFLEFEHVEALNDGDDYNQAGLNPGGAGKTPIADVEGTEINRLWLSGQCPLTGANVKFGRQRILIENQRFIGNVGWRQNEQTYDAVRVDHRLGDSVNLTYAYIWTVNRIFGEELGSEPPGAAANAAEYAGDSHLLTVSSDALPIGHLAAYAVLLDLDSGAVAEANSSDTLGARLTGTAGVHEDIDLAYAAEFAVQSDNSGSADGVDYEANYYALDVQAVCSGHGSVGTGLEVLESDSGAAFRTPLATGHKFNGWADVFLTTPDTGLEDTYVYAAAALPGKISGKVVYHQFQSNEGSIDYGDEVDAVLSRKLSDNVKVLAKYASYSADRGPENPKSADVERYSIEAVLAF